MDQIDENFAYFMAAHLERLAFSWSAAPRPPYPPRRRTIWRGVFPVVLDEESDQMEVFNDVTTAMGVIAVALVWYFGLGANRSSRALKAELQRSKPWNNSSSAEQAYRLRELELRRAYRNRVLYAAVSAGVALLSVFLQVAINERMDYPYEVAPRLSLPRESSHEFVLTLILFMLWTVAAGLFLFFAGRSLVLTVFAQRHRIPGGRLIIRDALRLSSYDDQGRNHLRRAATAALLSLASFVVLFFGTIALYFLKQAMG
jgi:hypothetical protein